MDKTTNNMLLAAWAAITFSLSVLMCIFHWGGSGFVGVIYMIIFAYGHAYVSIGLASGKLILRGFKVYEDERPILFWSIGLLILVAMSIGVVLTPTLTMETLLES